MRGVCVFFLISVSFLPLIPLTLFLFYFFFRSFLVGIFFFFFFSSPTLLSLGSLYFYFLVFFFCHFYLNLWKSALVEGGERPRCIYSAPLDELYRAIAPFPRRFSSRAAFSFRSSFLAEVFFADSHPRIEAPGEPLSPGARRPFILRRSIINACIDALRAGARGFRAAATRPENLPSRGALNYFWFLF